MDGSVITSSICFMTPFLICKEYMCQCVQAIYVMSSLVEILDNYMMM